MVDSNYQRLKFTLSEFKQLSQFLDDEFLSRQYKNGYKNYLIYLLVSNDINHDIAPHLSVPENKLSELSCCCGYQKLKRRLQDVTSWNAHEDFLAQVDALLWFQQKDWLKEIEPDLPHRRGSADILFSVDGKDVYCEVTAFQTLARSE